MDQYLGYLAGFVLAITLLGIGLQLVFAYALQTLANKNEMSSLAETLAWLPILNLYPFIACGGGSFSRFLIGAAVLLGGSIGLGVASAMSSSEGGMAFAQIGIKAQRFFAGLQRFIQVVLAAAVMHEQVGMTIGYASVGTRIIGVFFSSAAKHLQRKSNRFLTSTVEIFSTPQIKVVGLNVLS